MGHVMTRILRFTAFASVASVLGALVGWAEAAETPQPPQLRLGDAATPVSYEASLAIDPKETSFSGTIRIELRFNRAVPVLWLNASALTVEAAEIEQGARKIPVKVIPGGEDFVGFVPEEGSFDAGAAV